METLSDFYGERISIDYSRGTKPFEESNISFSGYVNNLPFFPVPFEINSLRIVLPDNTLVKNCSGGNNKSGIVTAQKSISHTTQSNEADESDDEIPAYSEEIETFRVNVVYRSYSTWQIILIITTVAFFLVILILLISLLIRNKDRIGEIILKTKKSSTDLLAKFRNRKTVKINSSIRTVDHDYKKSTKVKYCRKCGIKNDDNSKFCQYCGESLADVTAIDSHIRLLDVFLQWIKNLFSGNTILKHK